ncbi:MAG: hypothetical protein KGJ23_08590 [Euryarchaeota archaeon]|nr:hypothetical protein [Euryarchaeota archaeon]MDE1836660.1 hypothetical protein [Euryarchaeota archaeon]MDE1880311.1 hypothetical protein [Euryarchaeota archaeon]MDE2044630.1 hypothetical protein [Thermoplasmata archaeon]
MSENLCRCGRRLVKNLRLMEDECVKCHYPPDQCRCPKVQPPPEKKDDSSPSPKDKWGRAARKFQQRRDAHAATLGGRPVSLDQIRNYREPPKRRARRW